MTSYCRSASKPHDLIDAVLYSCFFDRLPIIQGGAFSFVVPIFAISEIRGECPAVSKNVNGKQCEHVKK